MTSQNGDGSAPTGGYSTSFTHVAGGSHHLNAFVLKTSPGEGCLVTQAFTSAFHIIETSISNDVNFHERAVSHDCI